MTRRQIIPACIYLLVCGAIGGGQDLPQANYTVRSQMVQVFLTVMDGKRRVTDLNVSDFSLREDGKVQKIDRLDSAEVPLQVALLLDTSLSMEGRLRETQEAAVTFVESMKAGDRITLIPFNSNIRRIAQLTDDFSPILRALRSTQAKNQTKLYDAILYAMNTLAEKEGRKAIVVFTDGEDTASAASLNLVLNASSLHGYPIYTVCAGPATGRPFFREVLRQIAGINNGRVFLVDSAHELRQAFRDVSDELRAAYVIYYYTLQSDERWHELDVSVSNPRYKIYARKGFYTGKLGAAQAKLGRKGTEETPFDGSAPAVVTENAKAALGEVTSGPATPREVEMPEPSTPPSGGKSKTVTIKVESHLVEVPLLVESLDRHDPPPLSERDFQVFEDSGRRDIAYFGSAAKPEDIPQAREKAIGKVGAGAQPLDLSTDKDLILARYYLVLDDAGSDLVSFTDARKAAEELLKKYHSTLRPFSVHFTSRGRVSTLDNLEVMLDQIRKAVPAKRQLSSQNEIISAYEAYMIDWGDNQARQLGELRAAQNLGLEWLNNLGKVEGICNGGIPPDDPRFEDDCLKANEPSITQLLRAKVIELIEENAANVHSTLEGLREIINMAAADPANYSKNIILVSPGFLSMKGSREDLTPLLDNIASMAKRRGLHIYVIDTQPASAENVMSAANSFRLQGPLLAAAISFAEGMRDDKGVPLDLLTSQTGGKRLKADNNIVNSASSIIAASGSLYYIAFLSKQPADGRFHKIRVLVNSRSVRLHARSGYYARPQSETKTAASRAAPEESLDVLVKKADTAMKEKDYSALADALEGISRKIPDRADIWFNLGVAYFNSKKPLEAVEAFQHALAFLPDDRAAGLMLSRSFAAAGNSQAAADTLLEMRRRRPFDAEILLQLGRVYEAGSQPGSAYGVYRSVLDFATAPPLDIYLLLIRTSAALGRYAETAVFMDDYRRRGGDESKIESWKCLVQSEIK